MNAVQFTKYEDPEGMGWETVEETGWSIRRGRYVIGGEYHYQTFFFGRNGDQLVGDFMSLAEAKAAISKAVL